MNTTNGSVDQKELDDEAIDGGDDAVRSAAASKGTTSRKRPRQSKSASPERKRPHKPKPPPAPPASLVSLMKRDKSVLRFFTSLQENVTYDVDKWKHEAAHWKKMASSASRRKVSGTKTTTPTKKSQRKSNINRKKQSNSNSPLLQCANNDEEGSTISITDEALFGELSDDDDHTRDSSASNAKDDNCNKKGEILDVAGEERRRSIILVKLIEAKSLLDLLGVSLVVIETNTSSANEVLMQTNDNEKRSCQFDTSAANGGGNQEESLLDAGPDTTLEGAEIRSKLPAERIIHRRSDEEVVGDMMASLRTLIEASSFINNHNDSSQYQNYHPFQNRGKFHCPSVYFGTFSGGDVENEQFETVSQHPASIGLKYLIDILTIMDVYCQDIFNEHDWDLLFDNRSHGDILSEENMTILKIGMRNRGDLVAKILSSLHVEITRSWANNERALHLDSSAMHFYPTDAINEQNSFDPARESAYCAKTFNRLVNLEERVAHGRIASLLYRRSGDFQKAAELVLGYVISSTPSLGVGYYHPKIPPALSMCILESLLSPEVYDPANVNSDRNERQWFTQFIQFISSRNTDKIAEEYSSLLLRAIAFATHSAANIWEERCKSSDRRIRDIALVEVAAYQRLFHLANATWLNIGTEDEEISKVGIQILSAVAQIPMYTCSNNRNKGCEERLLSCVLSLITIGNRDEIITLCGHIVTNAKCIENKLSKKQFFFLLPACCFAYSTIMSKRWESIKLESTSGRHTVAAFSVKNEFTRILEAAVDVVLGPRTDWENVDAIIQCYNLSGDALGLHRFAKRVISIMNDVERRANSSRIMSLLLDAAANITVRVINLERRPDRMLDFMDCAVNSERMLVMKGVAKLRCASACEKATAVVDGGGNDDGNFAFDGECSAHELGKQVAKMTGGSCSLSDFVKEEWKPSELSAFDSNADSDFKDAHATTSEKACALSHIATWFGVERELSCIDSGSGNISTINEERVMQLITISGFARGPPLLKQNEFMDPSPVCVIMEDDAIICDRFVERLGTLLDELPRDFHFCSIGYSRPKLAPIIEYSQELGIPTCLWYLTGYILSASGAQHLISSLPVVGPVDNWMAIKLRDNWENRYGDMIGVGKHTRAKYVPSQKELSAIMKFRAFAAKVPLCAQKQVTKENWRGSKDSDIIYSYTNQ